MSTFKWEISEPAEDAASGSQSGTVQLDDAKALSPAPVWRVQSPDGSVPLVPQPSGEVELTDHKDFHPYISKGLVNFALSVLVLVLGFIIIHDVILGNLSFEKLVWVTGSFIVGLNIGDRKSNQSRTTPRKPSGAKKS